MTTEIIAKSTDLLQKLSASPIYPVAVLIAFLLVRLVEFWAPTSALVRPLLLLGLGVVAVQIIATRLIGRDRGAYVTALIATAAFDLRLLALLYGAAVLALVWTSARARRLVRLDWSALTRALNVLSAVFLAVSALNVGTNLPNLPRSGGHPPSDPPASALRLPDIYLIMLDAYPRADTLQSRLDYDNAPFLTSMQEIGFEVAENAHSNYNATLLTLASMLNGRHVAELQPLGERRDEGKALIASINDGLSLDQLRDIGYSIVSIPSGITTTSLYSADEFRDTGQVNSFEASLLRGALLPRIAPGLQRSWLHSQHRDRITESLASLGDMAGIPSANPRFVLAHIMSPHSPVVFGADGSPVEGNPCAPESCDLWDGSRTNTSRDARVDQITYLNSLVVSTVRKIRDVSDQPPVIVVFSDHGLRLDSGDRHEMFRNLFLSYSPGHSGLFPDDATPINLIARIVNGYAGTNLALAEESSYYLDLALVETEGWFALVPWPT